MNKLIPFDFQGSAIRVVNRDGEPWFVATDVASALGHMNPQRAVRLHCKAAVEVGQGVTKTVTPLDPQITIIPECDVYRLVAKSKLPAAAVFEEWVVGTVLPRIRKTGDSGTPDPMAARADEPGGARRSGEDRGRLPHAPHDDRQRRDGSGVKRSAILAPALPVVFIRDGHAFTNTLEVAKLFGNRHDHVLRDVEAILHSPKLENEKNQIANGWFRAVEVDHPTMPGRKSRTFDMTRNGFSLLPIPDTGARAIGFKVAYILRFLDVEEELRREAAIEELSPEMRQVVDDGLKDIVNAAVHEPQEHAEVPPTPWTRLRRWGTAEWGTAEWKAVFQAVNAETDRLIAGGFKSPVRVLRERGVPGGKLRGPAASISAALRAFCRAKGMEVWIARSTETGNYVFHADAWSQWKRRGGAKVLQAFVEQLSLKK
jgi:Rha family phage regulatory protein